MLFNSREYYIISFIIIILAILWFMYSFEKRKISTREIVVIAVMTTMAIVGRIIFFMTPQIKPCAAIIIITGIMLGKKSGFLCGILTAFVSDFFFGQGPWTPWQMIAFGLIGLISGLIFSDKSDWIKNISNKKNKIVLSLYGFIVTFFVYGLIMDTATVLMYTDTPSLSAFAVSYGTGIIFNGIHGLSSFVFLMLLSQEMFEKLLRIKQKFGIYSEKRKIG